MGRRVESFEIAAFQALKPKPEILPEILEVCAEELPLYLDSVACYQSLSYKLLTPRYFQSKFIVQDRRNDAVI